MKRSAFSLVMSPHRLILAAVLALPSALLLFANHVFGFWFADSAFLGFARGGSFPLVHFSTNAFSIWSVLPGASVVFGPGGYSIYAAALLLTFSFGAFELLRPRRGTDDSTDGWHLHECLLVCAFDLILLRWYGIDIIVLSLLATLPLLLLAAKRVIEVPTENARTYLGVGLASALNCMLCHQLAILNACTVFLVLALGRERREPQSRLPCLFVALFIPAFAAALLSQTPSFPPYDPHGHLVPLYGVFDGLSPLIGGAPRLSAVDRQFERQAILPAAFVLTILAGIVAICERRIRGANDELLVSKAERRSGPLVAVVLAAAVLLDSAFVSATTSQLSPVQSFSRMIPGLIFFPVSLYLLALALFLLILTAARERVAKLLVAGGLCVAMAAPGWGFRKKEDAVLWSVVLSEASSPEHAEQIRVLCSPSYYVIREFGLDVVTKRESRKALKFVSASQFNPQLTASANGAQTAAVIDGKDTTRWTAGGGRQTGGEWLRIAFERPIVVSGVRVETGRYYTDFPRGIAVQVAESCSSDDAGRTSYATVFRRQRNEGEILYTADGFPYFSEQHNLSVVLPEPVQAQCLLLQQIGSDDHYEWSVSELELSAVAAAP
ncbi:MAG: discoidin domain-containing protein [Bdellovibrionota bacterium]